jgi:hypothetical protein
MRSIFILSLILLIATAANAFTSSLHRTNKSKATLIGSKTALIGSKTRKSFTLLSAAAAGSPKKATKKKKKAKKVAKKKATKKAVTAEKETVETFRKPEFISRVAEKTGMSKADSEAALAAVLETITEVSLIF